MVRVLIVLLPVVLLGAGDMCVSPVLIKNPNYGKSGLYARTKDTSSLYIKVPCGYCPQCIASRQMKVVQRCIMMCLDYHPFFGTLTYNNDSLPIWTFSNGVSIPFADFRDLTLMFKRIRKNNEFERDFKYFAVSEKGKKGRPHFHFLLFVRKSPGDDFNSCINLETRLSSLILSEWKRNYGTVRNPVYRPLCTYVKKLINGVWKYNFSLEYVFRNSSKSVDDVSYYVTKYMLKSDLRSVRLQQAMRLNLPEDEYNSAWLKVRPHSQWSKGFGAPDSPRVLSYLRRCISSCLLNGEEFPRFLSPAGKSMPLAGYYKSRGSILPVEDSLKFFENHLLNNPGVCDGYYSSDSLSESQINKLEYDFELRKKIVDGRLNIFDFSFSDD